MERTSPRQMTLENPINKEQRPRVHKPRGMNSRAWKPHFSNAGQLSQHLTYSDEAQEDHGQLRSNPQSNAVHNALHNMFALLERCEDNLKSIAAYTRAQELTWNNNTTTDERIEDKEMDDGASQTSACYFSDEDAIWKPVSLDSEFIAPLVAETTDDDLRAALRELHEQVRETMTETDVFSEGEYPDELASGKGGGDKNDDRLPEGATAVKGVEGNEIEYAHLRLTDRLDRDQLDNLSYQDHSGEEDSLCVDMSDIEEEGCRNLSELFPEESDLDPSEIFRVRNG